MKWDKKELENWKRELSSHYGSSLNKDGQLSLAEHTLELTEQLEQITANTKWVSLLRIFDRPLSESWHSGSAFSYKAKSGFNTREEAEEWMRELHHTNYQDAERYQVTECVLSYDEEQSATAEAFFKYMR
jgi:hypothetical protein